ncbi:hypothetical protein ACFPRL_24775 [Pseudoclavibacter helvolus]
MQPRPRLRRRPPRHHSRRCPPGRRRRRLRLRSHRPSRPGVPAGRLARSPGRRR